MASRLYYWRRPNYAYLWTDYDDGGEMTFEQWKQQVNLLLIKEFGVDADELPDHLWHDDFSDGLTPEEAFYDFVEYAV